MLLGQDVERPRFCAAVADRRLCKAHRNRGSVDIESPAAGPDIFTDDGSNLLSNWYVATDGGELNSSKELTILQTYKVYEVTWC